MTTMQSRVCVEVVAIVCIQALICRSIEPRDKRVALKSSRLNETRRQDFKWLCVSRSTDDAECCSFSPEGGGTENSSSSAVVTLSCRQLDPV
jgi:hypothetical protein